MKTWNTATLTASALLTLFGAGCSSDPDPMPGTGGVTASGGTTTTGGMADTGGTTSTGGMDATGGTTSTGGMDATGGTTSTGAVLDTGGNVEVGEKTIAELKAELDSSITWTDYDVVYTSMYTAFIPDSTHVFKVPARIQQDDTGNNFDTEVTDWSALPEGSVAFDADPDTGGVVATIVAYAPEILLTYSDGVGGGTAELFVTKGTDAQWQDGNDRYHNGNELDLSDYSVGGPDRADYPDTAEGTAAWLADVDLYFQMSGMEAEVEPMPDLECVSCHTTGAKYFEIQHTPTQAARFTDKELVLILTTGTKPEGIGFRVLPDEILGQTNEELYADFHNWGASEQELLGIIIYLRSLDPEGQGDIKLPDGTYVEAGSMPAP